jgi:hypothetical protein
MKKKILALLLTLIIVSLLVFSSPISASKGGVDSPKPGKGQGDTNHEHYGSPGHSETNERPGWGYGDRNHHRYGYSYQYQDDR